MKDGNSEIEGETYSWAVQEAADYLGLASKALALNDIVETASALALASARLTSAGMRAADLETLIRIHAKWMREMRALLNSLTPK